MLEDDPYGLVRFEGEHAAVALRPLRRAAIIYSSSFSKTIAPGLRVGWYVLPEALASETSRTRPSTYITPVLLDQAIVYEFIRRGNFEPNLVRVNGLLKAPGATRCSRRSCADLPAARWTRPEGGYFIWLELPRGHVDAASVLERGGRA